MELNPPLVDEEVFETVDAAPTTVTRVNKTEMKCADSGKRRLQ
jgi:hypothetical protein